ncbi:MAG: matrixin family metalloprotease [Thermoanaerobaculia bacterium]
MNGKLKQSVAILGAFALLAALAGPGPASAQGSGDPEILALMEAINVELAQSGQGIAVEQIEFFTFGLGRPSNRIHQQPFRWVPGDPRRLAQGIDITYLVDQSDGATASGLSNADTEAAIDRSMVTWDLESCLSKVSLVKRTDDGSDPDIFDSFFGFGGFGNPFAADIVEAGWLPRAFFEAVGGPGGGRGILAFSVTFIFLDASGNPSDINGDNYLDTALNEVYYNDTFGDPGDDRAGNPWGIDIQLPGIDVETVALHENGHSLGVGHFGPPPDAVMNPVYAGPRQSPLPIDQAGMCAVWASWPNP